MARRINKTEEVQKFGGTEDLGQVDLHGYAHDAKSIEVQSSTKLEQDEGSGNAAVIRCFEFGINLEAFKQHKPTKQELFNSHAKGIEISLWRDGLKVIPDVTPRIVVNEKDMKYQIFVGAQPNRGHILPYDVKTKTLKEIAHG